MNNMSEDYLSIAPLKMSLTIDSNEVIMLMAGSGEISIDWGDGTREPYSLLKPVFNIKCRRGSEHYIDWRVDKEMRLKYGFFHNYKNRSVYTITIKGENITHLRCEHNQLTELDVSNNSALIYLVCHSNRLRKLDVNNNRELIVLNCYVNQLEKLDLGNNTKLIALDCNDNKLTGLDVSKNIALTKLDCSNNLLTDLDVSCNTELNALYCWENQITSLDLSKNVKLTVLTCIKNQLTKLELSKNTALTKLYCANNPLKSFDVRNNPDIEQIYYFFPKDLEIIQNYLHELIIKRSEECHSYTLLKNLPKITDETLIRQEKYPIKDIDGEFKYQLTDREGKPVLLVESSAKNLKSQRHEINSNGVSLVQ